MLLDGIYYGKTPISRVYKNGQVIWSLGEYKEILLFGGANISQIAVAQITRDALNIVFAEYGINIENNVRAQSESSRKIPISVNASIGYYSDVKLQDLISTDPVDISLDLISDLHSDDSKHGNAYIDISLQNNVNIANSDSRQNKINETLLVHDDVTSRVSKTGLSVIDSKEFVNYIVHGRSQSSRIFLICDEIRVNHDVCMNASLSKHELISNQEVIGTDISANVSPSANCDIGENLIANAFVDVNSQKSVDIIFDNESNVGANVTLLSSEAVDSSVDEYYSITFDAHLNRALGITNVAHDSVYAIADTELSIGDTEYLKIDVSNEISNDLVLNRSDTVAVSFSTNEYVENDVVINPSETDTVVAYKEVVLHNDSKLVQSIADSLQLYHEVSLEGKNNMVSSDAKATYVYVDALQKNESNLVASDVERVFTHSVVNLTSDLDANNSVANALRMVADTSLCQDVMTSLPDTEVSYCDDKMFFQSNASLYALPEIHGDLETQSVIETNVALKKAQSSLANINTEIGNINYGFIQNSMRDNVDLKCDVLNNTKAKLSHGIFNWMSGFATKCITGCETTLSIAPREELWEYLWERPVKKNANLIITQAYHEPPSDGKLVLT